uniref:C6 domain-containing protein n=1 Tax=Panagrolaimus sp. ES5 TaxID=591445 RepID=A0AC34FPC4_9BILA
MNAAAGEVNPPVVQTAGTNAAGCQTITVTCTNLGGTQVFLFWEEGGEPRGTSMDGTATISRILTCNSDRELILTEPTGTGVVNNVECLAAAA